VVEYQFRIMTIPQASTIAARTRKMWNPDTGSDFRRGGRLEALRGADFVGVLTEWDRGIGISELPAYNRAAPPELRRRFSGISSTDAE